MASEIIPSGIGDLILSEVLSNEFLMLLADRDGNVLTHPSLLHVTAESTRSLDVKVRHIGLGGYDLLTTRTPGTDIANTPLSDGSTTVTLAPVAKAYEADDLSNYLTGDLLGVSMFAQDLAIAYAQTLISKLAVAGAGFTNVAGSTGVDLTWADMLAAKQFLGVSDASGPMLAILHPQQWGDLETDSLTLGYNPSQTNVGIIDQGLTGYKGRYMGIDIYVSSRVPTANAGADRAGCLVTPGALVWADARVPAPAVGTVASIGRATLELDRDSRKQSTIVIESAVIGASLAIDAAGVSIISDA